ncbi:hypothetical protein CROQUDRAFT_54260, partial [Cronartium quercuum f. sp. fusiforme G11]
NLSLLIPAYNHFVHYLSAARFKKETMAPGQFQIRATRSVTLRHRQRLCKAQLDFLEAQPGMPKCYLPLIAKPSAHSDDEPIPGRKDVYQIKTLTYCSTNANKFFQQVDVCMQKANLISGKTNQQHVQVLPKEPIMSKFVAPPTQLLIDFYSPTWFNALPPGQKEKIANSKCVTLLPNATKSLLPVPHPSKQL